MMYSDCNELTIDGLSLKEKEIEAYCQESESENIRDIGKFIAAWLDDKPVINVRTSGSTGNPREIEVKKEQLLQSASATAQYFGFKENQTALLCLPLSFIAGKMMVVRALYSKLNLVCIAPDHAPLASISRDAVIDFAALTPMQLKGTTDTKAVRKILLGGGPVSYEMEKSFQSLQAEIYHGFGMTETLSHIAIRKVNGENRSDTFQALPGVHFRKDERDCLVIDVPFLEEPVVTNDIVDLKSAWSFMWKGRLDHVINTGGIKWLPEEIEKKLFPLITERFFIAGLPDETLGEKLCLFIEGDPYPPEKLQIVKSNLVQHLSRYENPKEIYFLQKFKTTESGKIQRRLNVNLIQG
ncbi:MAG: AMP-binding protein [Chitinophagaceae bacterium]|nr:AMP-binding protein [Chitinophagaceae bacterium]